eukprot:TRINITY_DN2935_c0_g1_i1.p1 TRINITY_DN2935_c0_g1~~TRINITY_DN2935_c0_g1_i1.p1  ORF type:complete len:338 (+),score=85.92 TRINITY_DN2935_c0_g1_i1:538-1551(+)
MSVHRPFLLSHLQAQSCAPTPCWERAMCDVFDDAYAFKDVFATGFDAEFSLATERRGAGDAGACVILPQADGRGVRFTSPPAEVVPGVAVSAVITPDESQAEVVVEAVPSRTGLPATVAAKLAPNQAPTRTLFGCKHAAAASNMSCETWFNLEGTFASFSVAGAFAIGHRLEAEVTSGQSGPVAVDSTSQHEPVRAAATYIVPKLNEPLRCPHPLTGAVKAWVASSAVRLQCVLGILDVGSVLPFVADRAEAAHLYLKTEAVLRKGQVWTPRDATALLFAAKLDACHTVKAKVDGAGNAAVCATKRTSAAGYDTAVSGVLQVAGGRVKYGLNVLQLV